MIIALAGRRIDAPDTEEKRFPPEMKEIVGVRIREFFHNNQVEVLVSSAACGADLLAQKAARELGIERHIVLPFSREKFRETSVTDRPGDWGKLFDEICDEVERTGNLFVLEDFENDEAKAYSAVTTELLDRAQNLQSEGGQISAVAVWEGKPKSEADETASFIKQARERSIKIMEIPTVKSSIEPETIVPQPHSDSVRKAVEILRGGEKSSDETGSLAEPVINEVRSGVQQAINILRGKDASLKEMRETAEQLKNEQHFSYARRLLLRASKHKDIAKDKDIQLKVCQRLALCTYKDQDLPADERLDRALEILEQEENLCDTEKQKMTCNQETLGLLGSIYKRKWEIDNQRQNLERSLYYYLHGYRQGVVKDQGYTGINAAFVLDKLASLEEGEAEATGGSSKIAEERRAKAIEIREEIRNQIGALIDEPDHQEDNSKWWYYATVAEAYFGLRNYDHAVEWIIKGKKSAGQIYEWELESCARQLAELARFQDRLHLKSEQFADTLAWATLEKAFGEASVPRTAFLGKIGLALSGGGFRASLYHLGVLARLAELDVLRQVEIISCVSGGSIVGAHYYLKVRHLLQTKIEADITREHYIQIVRETIDEFLAGVKQNVRVSVAANPFKILRMLWQKDFSRTKRAGELYEKYLFSKVIDGGQNEDRWINELDIAPLIKNGDEAAANDKNFSPKYQNWRRDAKVPILVLNAATLNTGHTWQFTTSWMGESPAGIDGEIDGNDRLRRMYYGDAPEKYQKIRLGDAVGASAAVPGVFEPISFNELYEDHIVRLVDGGVCDNQGVHSLLEQDCKVFLVSDASGQMETERAAGGGIFSVLLRTNNVFQARIRAAQYHDLKGRKRSGLLNGFMFVHLKGDLEVDPVDWINCPDPYIASDDSRPPSRRGPLTRYGISKEIQELLSGIRTDLDSFSEAEAYALMTSGYRMTELQFNNKCVEGFKDPAKTEQWKFLDIEESMKPNGRGFEYLKTLLTAGGSIAFKVWQIDPRLKYFIRGLWLAVVTAITLFFYYRWDKPLPGAISNTGSDILNWLSAKFSGIADALPNLTLNQIVFAVAALFSGLIIARILASLVGDFMAQNIVRLVQWKDTLRRIVITLFISTIGFLIAWIHLLIFDKLFLRLGSVETLKKRSK